MLKEGSLLLYDGASPLSPLKIAVYHIDHSKSEEKFYFINFFLTLFEVNMILILKKGYRGQAPVSLWN